MAEPVDWQRPTFRRPPPEDSWQVDDVRGVPLLILASGDRPDGKGGMVNVVEFVDPDGIQFEVPREWVKFDVESANEKTGEIPHSVIDAPPGELERIWREATQVEQLRLLREQRGEPWDQDSPNDPDVSGVFSPLDAWNDAISNPQSPYKTGNFGDLTNRLPGTGGIPVRSEIAARSGAAGAPTGWNPSFRRPPPPTMRKEDIPRDAGSGWGNWNDVWNPKTQRWERRDGR